MGGSESEVMQDGIVAGEYGSREGTCQPHNESKRLTLGLIRRGSKDWIHAVTFSCHGRVRSFGDRGFVVRGADRQAGGAHSRPCI